MNKLFSKKVIEKFPRVINEALVNNSLQVAGIDMLITHQANLRIAQMNLETAESASGKVYGNIERFGNTTVATIPVALCEV